MYFSGFQAFQKSYVIPQSDRNYSLIKTNYVLNVICGLDHGATHRHIINTLAHDKYSEPNYITYILPKPSTEMIISTYVHFYVRFGLVGLRSIPQSKEKHQLCTTKLHSRKYNAPWLGLTKQLAVSAARRFPIVFWLVDHLTTTSNNIAASICWYLCKIQYILRDVCVC